MNGYTKFFKCDYCKGSSFTKKHSFKVDFKEVNFTNELIYDLTEVKKFKCDQCGRTYTEIIIKETLKELIRKYKEDYWEQEMENM
jgi:hypothetical protein